MRRLEAAIVLIVLTVVACGRETPATRPRGPNPPVVATEASLARFDACPELVSHLKSEATKRVGPYGLPGGVQAVATPLAATEGRSAGVAEDTSAAAPSFSGTNVQEANVDEPDVIKTNGRHVFTIRPQPDNEQRQQLVAIAVGDDAPRIVGSVLLPEAFSYELLLAGERVLAMGQKGGYAIADGREMIAPVPQQQATIIAAVDVSDAAKPRVANTLELEGTYASARMIGGIARIVLNSSQTHIDFVTPKQPTLEEEKKALEQNKKLIDKAKIEDWLPRFKMQDSSGAVSDDGVLASCGSTYYPKTFSGFQTVSVVTVDPANPNPRDSAAIIGSAGTVYASTDNLYVATHAWPEAQPLILRDTAVGAPAPIPVPAKTQLHRFDIRDATKAAYAASGEVRGTVLNQWSLSEHEGYFRVATTEERFGNGEQPPSSASFVTVLTATAGELKEVASISDIAPGERIYGVRFMGDVGYVVTFKQIDPLHVIDLSAPDAPKILGELEIPGYSAYLHPVGDGLLLGVGQDATLEGRPIGTVVSLFDVRDPAKPARLDKVTIRNGHSPVEYDHHAFTWWEPRKLAVVPAESFDEVRAQEGKFAQESSAYAYRVDGDTIDEVGRVSHLRHGGEFGFAAITRSIVIGDRLYTLSQAGLMASDLASFAERGWVALHTPSSSPPGGTEPGVVTPD